MLGVTFVDPSRTQIPFLSPFFKGGIFSVGF